MLLQLGGVQSMYDGLEGGVKQVRAALTKVKEEVSFTALRHMLIMWPCTCHDDASSVPLHPCDRRGCQTGFDTAVLAVNGAFSAMHALHVVQCRLDITH